MGTLQREIAKAINNHSAENPSNTPDFILAEFLTQVLGAWDDACRKREDWYGYHMRPPMPDTIHRTTPDGEANV